MTTWDSLVHQIRCAPDEDAPRLDAADWLQKRGDARGEYIARAVRKQAAVARDAEREKQWAQHVAALARNNSFEFTRGFIEELHFEEDEAANLGACCKLEPITRVVLRDTTPGALRAVADSPELGELRSLSVVRPEDSCAKLLVSRRLAKHDEVYVDEYAPDVIGALVGGAVRPRVFSYNGDIDEDPDVLGALVDGGFFARIEKLELVAMNDELVEVLARAPLAALRRLELSSGHISTAALEALGARLDRLEELVLNDTPLGRDTAKVAISNMSSGNLRRLECFGNADEGIVALVKSPAFRNVEELSIHGEFETKALTSSRHRQRLRKVTLTRPEGLALEGVEIVADDY